MISILFACQFPSVVNDDCFSDPPALGEVRLDSISCGDEFQSDHNRRGDWVLENALERFVIRHESSSLSHMEAPGGTLIDAGTEDLIFELRPLGALYPLNAQSHTSPDQVSLSFYYGEDLVVAYTLAADSHILDIASDHDFLLYPNPQTIVRHEQLYFPQKEHGISINGDIADTSVPLQISNLAQIDQRQVCFRVHT